MSKDTVTTRVESETHDYISTQSEARDVTKAQVVRELIERGREADQLEERVDALEKRLERREDRIDDLEEQLARRSQIEEKVDTLATTVEEQQGQTDAPFWVRWLRYYREK